MRSPVAENFAENLRRCRKQRGLSQEALGYAANLHRTEIGLLETGARVAKIDTLIRLSGALKIEPGKLLEGIVWEPTPEPKSSRGGFSIQTPDAGEVDAPG